MEDKFDNKEYTQETEEENGETELFDRENPVTDGQFPGTGIANEPAAAQIPADETGREVKPDKKAPEKKKGAVAGIAEWIELFAISVAVVMTLLICIGRHSPVIGSSMNETLQENDLLIISDLFYTPKQGDIVVFESERTTYEKPYVKRIIAVAGQTVDFDPETNEVRVDGETLSEDYVTYKGAPRSSYSAGIVYPYTVPEGHIFVMGDNRWNSTDSRDIGPVDQRCIIGRVLFRLFPVGQFRSF